MTPLVLVHGVGLDRHMWAAFAAALGSPTITYDMLGLGDAPKPAGPYTLSLYAEQLADVVREAPSQPVDVIGFSMGGVIARAMVRDLFDPRESARLYGALMLVTGLAPMLAPLIGGHLLVWFGWPAIFTNCSSTATTASALVRASRRT